MHVGGLACKHQIPTSSSVQEGQMNTYLYDKLLKMQILTIHADLTGQTGHF